MADWTVDANILIYCVDRLEAAKRDVAETVMAAANRDDIALARQAIGEFFHAASRKGKLPPEAAAAVAADYLRGYDTFGANEADFEVALAEAATGRTQFWDAVLLAACARSGIMVLLTEDLAQGQHRLGVEIVNPFAPSPAGRKAMKKRGISAR